MIKFILSTLLVLFNINEINGFSRTIPNIKEKIISKNNFQMSSNICPEYLSKFTSFLDQEKSEAIVKGTTSFLTKVDGVMIGRAIYHSPYLLADIEKEIFKNENVPTRTEVMENLIPYIEEQTSKGVQLNHIMRHTVGLFHGQNGSKTWKQYLSKNMCIRDADLQKVNHIMDQVRKNNPVSLER